RFRVSSTALYLKEKDVDMSGLPEFAVYPLIPARWLDLETLFGPRGACGGCWCMWWRLPRATFDHQKGEANRRDFRALVQSGVEPGLLGYVSNRPVAWCAVAPREGCPALERSRILKRLDDAPVWSVTCLFVARTFRRQGLTVRMLEAAVAYAGERGAQIVEG